MDGFFLTFTFEMVLNLKLQMTHLFDFFSLRTFLVWTFSQFFH